MRRVTLMVAVMGSLGLVGCATTTDPREGGLLGGIQGMSSGAYDQRVQEREDRLARLRETQRELESEREDLEARKARQSHEVALERERLAALDRDVTGLSRQVEGLSARHGEDDARVKELQTRLDDLQGRMQSQQSALDALEGTGMGDTETDLRRRQLEEQRNALREEFDLLMELSLDLAR
ncbi:hypothetical protein [Ectothiorhodospira variabilis]|uniref:hypothetical protein n=1 Tax=Ectothiorhodospira variabilis TaxID=505694 RepID=UPI001EFA72DC|nr:hypothetical protein [Ectothiorhodospira variabilis]MCG5495598.1 hypothetical protein [Ectothiorhodospira variabilis]MCG5503066.1 hypothetical protein [Ectothiorhodospira variabilis]MCG5506175.1 hypothetical protein [Ectothiorhodospira variabilis]